LQIFTAKDKSSAFYEKTWREKHYTSIFITESVIETEVSWISITTFFQG